MQLYHTTLHDQALITAVWLTDVIGQVTFDRLNSSEQILLSWMHDFHE